MLRWKGVISGALSFVAAHLVETAAWRQWFDPAGQYGPWFLNSGRAVAFTAGCLLLGGAASAIRSSDRRAAFAQGVSVAAGACVAMAVVLFATGPGTLFPIVLAIGGSIAIVSALAGALASWLLTRRVVR
jgi:hypothetical protein